MATPGPLQRSLLGVLPPAAGGHAQYNHEQTEHGEAPVSLVGS